MALKKMEELAVQALPTSNPRRGPGPPPGRLEIWQTSVLIVVALPTAAPPSTLPLAH